MAVSYRIVIEIDRLTRAAGGNWKSILTTKQRGRALTIEKKNLLKINRLSGKYTIVENSLWFRSGGSQGAIHINKLLIFGDP